MTRREAFAMLWRARRLRCGARPDLSGAWCSFPRSYVFHEDGNSSLMSVFIALMSAPGRGLPEVAAGHEVGARPGFLAGDGARWTAGRVPQCDVRHNSLCIQLCTESNIARRRDDHARGWLRPAAGPRFAAPGPASCCPGTAWLCGRYALPWVRPGRRFVVPGGGRLAQRESASFTPRRSLVRSQYRPPPVAGRLPAGCHLVALTDGPSGYGSFVPLGGIWEINLPGYSGMDLQRRDGL